MRSEILLLALTTYDTSNACFISTAKSGLIAGAVPARSVLWAWELPASLPSTQRMYLERVRIQFTTITAFTVPVTAGRGLALTRLLTMPTGGAGGVSNRIAKTAFLRAESVASS